MVTHFDFRGSCCQAISAKHYCIGRQETASHWKVDLIIDKLECNLKEQCHEDFAVLGQFCAKIVTLRI